MICFACFAGARWLEQCSHKRQVFMVVVSEWERDKRRGEEENEVLLVVWISPEAATMVAYGRTAKEGEQMKALAMSLMEVN
ncbi:hypothetical protein KY289_023921 [Solanum tuberosum]|nr:hypothetical protein KY289_023921 [Solanum tuberosum]